MQRLVAPGRVSYSDPGSFLLYIGPRNTGSQPSEILTIMSPHLSSSFEPSVPIRILVADRNRMVSQLLAESLGRDPRFEICGVVAAADVLSLAESTEADVAVISLDTDGANKRGLQVTRTLSARHATVGIVALLEVSARESVIASFRCGATGVFCRTEPLSELPTCIERVSRGEIWASSIHSQFLLDALRSTPSCEGIGEDKIGMLSDRELQVAEHAAQGQSNRQIADRLGLSEHTIKNYLFRIFDKLGVSNRIELLFLLFKECNAKATGRSGDLFGSEIGNSIETYITAAEQGAIAAQFVVGMAHLDGYCVEKNDSSAYYWLRMAEESSDTIRQRSRALVEKLRRTVKPDDIQAAERRVAIGGKQNDLLRNKLPAEFLKPSAGSVLLGVPRGFSGSSKSSKAAS